jgi:hypothetical protein
MSNWRFPICVLGGLVFSLTRAWSSPPVVRAAEPAAPRVDRQVAEFIQQHCLRCHGEKKTEGKLRLDQLDADFSKPRTFDRWQTVVHRLRAGEMPPEGEPRPDAAKVAATVRRLTAQLEEAAANRRAAGRVVLRRLNRVEYENTVRDLLGVEVDLQDLLPQDSSASGFDNVGEALHTSSFLMEKYLEAADKALNLAIANDPQPKTIKQRYGLKDTHHVKIASERVFRKLDDTVVLFTSVPWQAVTLSPFYPPDRGKYRFRISVSGFQSSDKPVVFRIDAGPMLMATKNHLIGYFDAPADKPIAEKPRIVEFVDHLEARSTIRIHPYGLAGSQTVDKVGADKYEGPGLAVQWVEVEGPLHESWPPESHRRIFGDLPQALVLPRDWHNRVEVVSKNPEADAERILRNFARRAFRRTVTDEDIKPLLALVKAKLAEKRSFEQAVRVGLLAAMMSPEFLFLREKVGAASRAAPGSAHDGGTPGPARLAGPTPAGPTLDDFALASRLSYFLWSTMPDEELLKLAEQSSRHAPRAVTVGDSLRESRQLAERVDHKDGTRSVPATLADPATLRRQVERMLNHPKAAAFTENFVGQWLGLRDIDFTEPSQILYPEFDDMLKVSMVRETELFFAELLKHDLSLTNFVASDFTLLNGRLARHYGIPGVDGWEFRKVTLPPESHRGGVLTMASVLKVTANGTSTSPVTRGAWVMDRILGTPPPRPPADVPALEPDIRGATTIREQLAKHRKIESCAACHAKIDPPGFALESFDVIGGWRENYRTSGNGEAVMVDGRRMPYHKGKKVDPADVLPDGRKFKDIDELKQLLLTDKDQLARALTEKLVTYATGAPPAAADKPEIEAIVGKVREKNYGLRTLVHEIVQSKAFQNK